MLLWGASVKSPITVELKTKAKNTRCIRKHYFSHVSVWDLRQIARMRAMTSDSFYEVQRGLILTFWGSYESSSCKVHSVHCCIIIIIRSWWSEKSFWWKMANYRCCQRMNCNQLQSFIKFIWYGTKKGSTNLFWQDQIRIMND